MIIKPGFLKNSYFFTTLVLEKIIINHYYYTTVFGVVRIPYYY